MTRSAAVADALFGDSESHPKRERRGPVRRAGGGPASAKPNAAGAAVPSDAPLLEQADVSAAETLLGTARRRARRPAAAHATTATAPADAGPAAGDVRAGHRAATRPRRSRPAAWPFKFSRRGHHLSTSPSPSASLAGAHGIDDDSVPVCARDGVTPRGRARVGMFARQIDAVPLSQNKVAAPRRRRNVRRPPPRRRRRLPRRRSPGWTPRVVARAARASSRTTTSPRPSPDAAVAEASDRTARPPCRSPPPRRDAAAARDRRRTRATPPPSRPPPNRRDARRRPARRSGHGARFSARHARRPRNTRRPRATCARTDLADSRHVLA